VAVFQPHRYSRTEALLDEFGRAFVLADHVVVTEVYAAGEAPIPGIDGRAVVDSLRRHGHRSVVFEPRLDRIAPLLRDTIRPGDLVITMGAGDIRKVGDALVNGAGLKARSPRRAKKP
jgi:UDP-N-acetylmuramate--alanine ligase